MPPDENNHPRNTTGRHGLPDLAPTSTSGLTPLAKRSSFFNGNFVSQPFDASEFVGQFYIRFGETDEESFLYTNLKWLMTDLCTCCHAQHSLARTFKKHRKRSQHLPRGFLTICCSVCLGVRPAERHLLLRVISIAVSRASRERAETLIDESGQSLGLAQVATS